MAVRTAYAGTAVDGDVYTAANHARMPGGWIGYVESGSAQGPLTAETDITGMSVTVTVNADRRIRITGEASMGTPGGGTDTGVGRIKEGGTTLGVFAAIEGVGQVRQSGSAIVTPTAGSHTYKLTMAGTGTGVETFAGATEKVWLAVEDIGPAT